jgi:hypothetical protein
VQHARQLVLHRRGRRTGPCRRCGGGALVRGHRGCWCLGRGRGRRRGLCRLQRARERLEAGVVIGRGHGEWSAADGSSARCMLGAVRSVGMKDVLSAAVNAYAWTPARPGSPRRLGTQYAARSRWTTPQRRVFAVDAGELWRAAVRSIGRRMRTGGEVRSGVMKSQVCRLRTVCGPLTHASEESHKLGSAGTDTTRALPAHRHRRPAPRNTANRSRLTRSAGAASPLMAARGANGSAVPSREPWHRCTTVCSRTRPGSTHRTHGLASNHCRIR